MSVKISLTGVKEIDAVLRGLPLQFSESILFQTHKDAAFPLVSAAHMLAPVGETGNLAESIGTERVGVKRGGEIGSVAVGPRRSGGFKGFHAHLIEFGKTNRDGTKTAPRPFMEPAFNNTKGEVERGIASSLAKRTYNFIRRTIKNG